MANIKWSEPPEGHDEQCEMFGRPRWYGGRKRSPIDCWCRERSETYPEWIGKLRQPDVTTTEHRARP